jgi:voltage-gated potassium channel
MYGAGAVLGVAAMFANDVYDSSIVTASKCRLLKLQREDFHRLSAAHPRVASRIRELAESLISDAPDAKTLATADV